MGRRCTTADIRSRWWATSTWYRPTPTSTTRSRGGAPRGGRPAAAPPTRAGAHWAPASHYRRSKVTPDWYRQYIAAADYAYRRFQIMVGEDYGIRWMRNYVLSRGPIDMDGEAGIVAMQPERRLLEPSEHPFAYPYVSQWDSPIIEPPRFLRQIQRDILLSGGRIVVRAFATPADIAPLPETLVFNCTGLGARDLFGDAELHPVRGQLVVLLPQPEVDYAIVSDDGYMFSRSDGVILGGTFEHNQWSTEPDPRTTQRILRDTGSMFSGWRC